MRSFDVFVDYVYAFYSKLKLNVSQNNYLKS